jgi:hypothetical protein
VNFVKPAQETMASIFANFFNILRIYSAPLPRRATRTRTGFVANRVISQRKKYGCRRPLRFAKLIFCELNGAQRNGPEKKKPIEDGNTWGREK